MNKALHTIDDIDYVSRNERRRGLASFEDNVDASIKELKENIKKSNDRLITVASDSTDNVRTNKK